MHHRIITSMLVSLVSALQPCLLPCRCRLAEMVCPPRTSVGPARRDATSHRGWMTYRDLPQCAASSSPTCRNSYRYELVQVVLLLTCSHLLITVTPGITVTVTARKAEPTGHSLFLPKVPQYGSNCRSICGLQYLRVGGTACAIRGASRRVVEGTGAMPRALCYAERKCRPRPCIC